MNKTTFFKLKRFTFAILWLLIILVLSGYPGDHVPKVAIWQFDKIVHTLMYGILSFLLIIPFGRQFLIKNNRFKVSLIVVSVAVCYGGFMEILQNSIFINRSGNWLDFMANTLGAILGVIIYPFLTKILPINRWLKIK